jgi:hypothetical protein
LKDHGKSIEKPFAGPFKSSENLSTISPSPSEDILRQTRKPTAQSQDEGVPHKHEEEGKQTSTLPALQLVCPQTMLGGPKLLFFLFVYYGAHIEVSCWA